jgi:hypothetical protein
MVMPFPLDERHRSRLAKLHPSGSRRSHSRTKRWYAVAIGVAVVALAVGLWQPWVGGGKRSLVAGARQQCQAGFAVIRDSGSDFTASLTLTYAGPSDLPNWQAGFEFPGTQTVQPDGRVVVTPAGGSPYDATMVQNGASVVLRPVARTALRSGSSVTVAIHAAYQQSNPLPTAFTVDGLSCRAQVSGATSAPSTPPGIVTKPGGNNHGGDNHGGDNHGNDGAHGRDGGHNGGG